MPRRFVSLDEFAPPASEAVPTALSVSGRALETLDARCVRYSFSDSSVGRDMHTIAAGAWDLRNFEANPVFLWAHQDDELPVGRVENLETQNGRLVGQVRYAEHAFADTVYQLVKNRYLNATSTGWLPLEWRAANDRARPGGLDFTRVELLEISQVPVPALPTALATARSAGINTRPLFDWAERLLDHGDFAVVPRADLESLRKAARMPHSRAASKWKCDCARDLAVDDKTAWDGEAATKRMLDEATSDGKIDADKAKRGFLLYDAGAADERGAYKEPFADIVDGRLVAVAGGVRAAAQRLPDVKDVGDDVKAEAEKAIEAYHGRITKEADDSERGYFALARKLKKRDLCTMADLAYYLAYLENIFDRVAAEAAREEDGSEVPTKLRAWLDDGNRLLLEMAGEETQEQIDGTQDENPYAYYWSAAKLETVIARALDSRGFVRKGAKHSAETLRCLRAIHGHLTEARDALAGMLGEADDADPETDDPSGEDGERALRERRARAAAIKARSNAA